MRSRSRGDPSRLSREGQRLVTAVFEGTAGHGASQRHRFVARFSAQLRTVPDAGAAPYHAAAPRSLTDGGGRRRERRWIPPFYEYQAGYLP